MRPQPSGRVAGFCSGTVERTHFSISLTKATNISALKSLIDVSCRKIISKVKTCEFVTGRTLSGRYVVIASHVVREWAGSGQRGGHER
jgi:hypothetical protein